MAKSSAKKKEPAPPKPRVWVRALILIAIGIWIYSPVLLGDWNWDDNLLVSENTYLRSWNGLGQLWISVPIRDYWPVTWTVLWIEWHLWGGNTLGYHLVSLALHLCSAFLIWRLLARLGLREGWLGGLLFVVHPLTVESVAWISEIKNTLSLPFYLLACHAYLDAEEDKKSRGYGRSVAFYLAAMLSKTSTVMFPVILLLYSWTKSGKLTLRDLRKITPYLLIALPLSLMTVYFQNHQVATRWHEQGDFIARMIGALLAVGFYIGKFLWPANLVPIYPTWSPDPSTIISAVFAPILALLLVTWLAWRSKESRRLWLGFGFFLLNLFPVLGLVNMKYLTWVADHFVYLPMIGLTGLVVAGWQQIQARSAQALHLIEMGILAVIMAVLAFGSHSYAALFVNRETLWTYALQLNPDIPPAESDLSMIALQEGRVSEAIDHAQRALRLMPGFSAAHNNLGKAYFKLGRIPEAEREFAAAVELDPENANAHNNLAGVLAQSGHSTEAMDQFSLALKYAPNQPDVLAGRGELKRCLGDWDGALADLDQAAQLAPDTAAAYLSRAVLRRATGDSAGALSDLRRYRELAPDELNADYALLWIWIIRSEQGRKSFADEELSDALRTNWNASTGDWVSQNARFLLGDIKETDYLASAAAPDKARTDGQLCEAMYYAGVKLRMEGNKAAAIVAFRSCLAKGKNDYFEYTLAQGELSALQAR